MESLTVLLPIYVLIYVAFITRLIFGFSKIKTVKYAGAFPKTTFSIVIPFRNEAENLPSLLESIKNLNYPKTLFEVIFIDDFSEDTSEKLIYKWRMDNGEFHVTLIESVRISGSPKKDAIARAVPIVVNDWIVTTDADCVLPESWLATLNDHILDHDVRMIAGPVVYKGKNNFSHHFQQMDLLSLQGATMGSFGIGKPFMCNGANFAYDKKLFAELKGFEGNDNNASGDDVFLLQKAVAKYPEKVHYLKSTQAIVVTKPVDGWPGLFYQRVRWASKTASYENDFGETLAWVVFLGNLALVAGFALSVAKLFAWKYLLALFILKFVVDTILLIQANGFLRHREFFFPVFSALLYPFFSVAVALYSVVGKYEWKGRKFR
jgi:cellulose synthase/poly-beta-1,6-N-acetylglucosamine synthase-like glycosyltransferase